MKEDVLVVDPGMSACGWVAVRPLDGRYMGGGTIVPPKELKGPDWRLRAHWVADALRDICVLNDIHDLWYEEPAYFNSVGGQMVAGKGDLAKLIFFTGYMEAHVGVRCYPVPVKNWKGQLTKVQTTHRIIRFMTLEASGGPYEEDMTEHELDAWGIALYLTGQLVMTKKRKEGIGDGF